MTTQQILTDGEWLDYLLKHADAATLHVAAYEYEGRLRLRTDANNLRKLAEAAILAKAPQAQPEQATQGEAVAWRDHVEQRLNNWRFQTEDGDMLGLDDFMSNEVAEDLIDYVCDDYADPAPSAAVVDVTPDLGYATMMGDEIYAGIFEDEIWPVTNATILGFDSNDALRAFLTWHYAARSAQQAQTGGA